MSQLERLNAFTPIREPEVWRPVALPDGEPHELDPQAMILRMTDGLSVNWEATRQLQNVVATLIDVVNAQADVSNAQTEAMHTITQTLDTIPATAAQAAGDVAARALREALAAIQGNITSLAEESAKVIDEASERMKAMQRQIDGNAAAIGLTGGGWAYRYGKAAGDVRAVQRSRGAARLRNRALGRLAARILGVWRG